MFPRRDGIVLGGTWDHDDWSLTPDPEQATGILEAHMEIMKNLKEPEEQPSMVFPASALSLILKVCPCSFF